MTEAQVRTGNPMPLAAVALAVIAMGCAVWFGWSWYRTAHADALGFAQSRDAVLRDGEQAIQNMNTLDYRHVDQGLATWQQSSTGDLLQQITQGKAQFEQQVQQARTVTTAKVLDGAVTELDQRAGKASVMVAVQITVTPHSGSPSTKGSRLLGQLTRTTSGWKLSSLGQEPVGTSGAASGPSPSAGK